MNLQRLLSMREGHRSVIKHHLEKINDAKGDSTLIVFNTILDALESMVKLLGSLNEKILGQTEVATIEEEIITAEEYSLELEINLQQLRAFRDQGECSIEIQPQPPFPRDTRTTVEESQSNVNTAACENLQISD